MIGLVLALVLLGQEPAAPTAPAMKVTPPKVVEAPPPENVRDCRIGRQYDIVARVGLVVDVNGNPQKVAIVRSSGNDCFDDRALEAARRYRFKPATRNGDPVAVGLAVEVRFRSY